MRFELHEMQKDGTVWHSGPLDADRGDREIRQRVIAGYTKLPRWATAVDGAYFYGIDSHGKPSSVPVA